MEVFELPFRAAGNWTRSTCTPCMRTAGILQPGFIKFIMTFFRLKFHSKKFHNPISIFFLLFLAKLAKRWASSRALNKIFFDASANSWKDFFVPNGKISLSFCLFDMPNIDVFILLSRKTLETVKTWGRPPSMTIKSGAGHSLCRV